MDAAQNPIKSREKVRAHRARLRAAGLRPIQIWVPDMRADGFAEAAHRQALAVANSAGERADQAFIDAISDPDEAPSGAHPVMRGEIWTVAAGSGYAGKPRPAVILQDDHFAATRSVTLCVFTTEPTEAPLFRLPVTPTAQNGLREPSWLMVDRITTVPRAKLGQRLGALDEKPMRYNFTFARQIT